MCSLPKHEPGYPGGIFAPFIPGKAAPFSAVLWLWTL